MSLDKNVSSSKVDPTLESDERSGLMLNCRRILASSRVASSYVLIALALNAIAPSYTTKTNDHSVQNHERLQDRLEAVSTWVDRDGWIAFLHLRTRKTQLPQKTRFSSGEGEGVFSTRPLTKQTGPPVESLPLPRLVLSLYPGV